MQNPDKIEVFRLSHFHKIELKLQGKIQGFNWNMHKLNESNLPQNIIAI